LQQQAGCQRERGEKILAGRGEKLSLFARKLGIQMIAGAGDITTQAQRGAMHMLSQKRFHDGEYSREAERQRQRRAYSWSEVAAGSVSVRTDWSHFLANGKFMNVYFVFICALNNLNLSSLSVK
jgi:hypothetical protein